MNVRHEWLMEVDGPILPGRPDGCRAWVRRPDGSVHHGEGQTQDVAVLRAMQDAVRWNEDGAVA